MADTSFDTRCFSESYFAGRDRFRALAESLQREFTDGVRLVSYPLSEHFGPLGETLSIDVCIVGDEEIIGQIDASSQGENGAFSARPRRVMLHVSGTHGAEGFAGSAVQCALLHSDLRKLLSGNSWNGTGHVCVFVHALNPFGMAHGRRVNENSVDLNRNFYLNNEEFENHPTASGFLPLNSFLEMPNAPTLYDSLVFWPRAAYLIATHGLNTLKNTIATGQNLRPRSLFYVGTEQQFSTRTLLQLLRQLGAQEGTLERLVIVDVHTGLGAFSFDTLLSMDSDKTRMREVYGAEHVESDTGESIAYTLDCDMGSGVAKFCSESTDSFYACQEFGTYAPVKMLHGLIWENAEFHANGRSGGELLDLFYPRHSEQWKLQVLKRGVKVFHQALQHCVDRGSD